MLFSGCLLPLLFGGTLRAQPAAPGTVAVAVEEAMRRVLAASLRQKLQETFASR